MSNEPPKDPWEKLQEVARVLHEYEQAWNRGEQPPLRDWLARYPHLADELGPDLVGLDWELRQREGQLPHVDDYADLDRRWVDAVRQSIEASVTQTQVAPQRDDEQEPPQPEFPQPEFPQPELAQPELAQPEIHQREFPQRKPREAEPRQSEPRQSEPRQSEPREAEPRHSARRESAPRNSGSRESDKRTPDPLPSHIGRFRVERRLGKGGFGSVYLAYDTRLQRSVAIKVPHPGLWSRLKSHWIREARIVAQFDHPHIVPVYEVGSATEFPAYIVSKYIDGCSLAERLRQSPLPLVEAIDLIIAVAEALDYAHCSRDLVVHRDIKPGNLLLDQQGKVYVADFGLALRESDPRQAGTLAGTPAYMSPEQVRGEGHLVDGRSDIFSLGVVLYELLTGRRPFRGNTDELLTEIRQLDPKPPRQLNVAVSPELERICLKTLAKLASDRYSTARDLAADLRLLRASEGLPGTAHPVLPTATPLSPNSPPTPVSPLAVSPGAQTPSGLADSNLSPSGRPFSDRTLSVVPKGLRSFDAGDSGFFLELLPGARDRTGLPDSLRFWKARIEQTDGARPLRVGLLTGPSGCGKSSLVKAGLLPRLSDTILPLYLEATTDDTERRLVAQLHRHLPRLEETSDLAECLTRIRRGQAGLGQRRLLLVIDQFEQWLHSHQAESDTPLSQAMRQCDGERLQTLLLVRDDYSLAVYRFLRQLEIPLVQGENNAVVDLFDGDHARRVLEAFGRAFGKLPPPPDELSAAQRQFVEQAVEGIAEQNRVVPVRLALFAEMFRHRPWTVEGLISVGGAEGVGRVFLEETFRSDRAPPQYRQHSQGAQQVLTALLPDVGSDIRGHRRSQGELIEAAGYTGRPREGAELLQILDQDLRLISPIEAPSAQAVPAASGPEASSSTSSPPETDRQYHLTHDYLVPSLRRWVEDILGSTPAGRAKLLLRERSRLWNDRPLDRNLPTWGEHLRIRRRTDPAQRTDVERRMLARAAVVHGRNVSFMMVVLTGLALGSWWFSHRLEQQRFAQEVSAAVDQLATAQPATWARVLERLREPRARSLASERLARIMANVAAESRAPTVAERIAQLTIADDRTQLEPLRDVLLTGPIQEFLPTREQLRPYGTTLAETLWNILRDEEIVAPQRARAAMALAAFAPAPDAVTPASDEVPTQDWGVEDIKFICRQMVACTPDELPVLTEAMRPVSRLMIDQLEQVFAENFRQRKKLASHMRISVLQNAINLNQELDRRVSRAAQVVAKYPEVVPPAQMVRLIALSTPAEFATLFSAWETQLRNNCENILARIASEVPADQMLSEPRIAFARQRASTAVALLRLGRWQQALKVCDMADDPEAMTRFMLECRSRGASIQTLLRCLDEVSQHDIKLFDPRVRYALLIALGTFPISDVPAAERRQRTQQVTEWYRNDPSSSVHGAAGWLLRQWGATENAIEVEQTAVPYEAGREWYTQVIDLQPKSKPANTTGQSETPPPLTKIAMTFIIFPAGEYAIGLPNHTSGEAMRRVVTLSRPFALMDREVTVGEMAAFQPDHFADSDGNLRGRKGHPSVAVGSVKWYDAVEYCRWLGFQCQLGEQQQCYAAHDSDELQGYDRDVDTEFYLDPYNRFPRLWPLKLGQAGYRLPTEAEWEVASRGLSLANGLGTVGRTLYGFGSEPELLEYFGWFRDNSGERQHEVRSRVPSLRGLWDMHGGQSEWVHDMHPGPWRAAREIDPTGNNSGMDNFHVQRGGSYSRSAMDCSSTYLHWDSAKRSTSDAGFRVAVFPSH